MKQKRKTIFWFSYILTSKGMSFIFLLLFINNLYNIFIIRT